MVVVGAALIRGDRLLACRRTAPPELAGRWEFPGGKVEPGENDIAALVRECREELGLPVTVGGRLGPDVALGGGTAVLRVYVCAIADTAEPQPAEHDLVRWLSADELADVPWIEADLGLVRLAADLLRSYATPSAGGVVQNPHHGLCPG